MEIKVRKHRMAFTIRYIRRAHGISQEYVADVIGMTQSAYSKIENGKREMTLDTLINLANFYNMTLGEFVSILEGANVNIIDHETLVKTTPIGFRKP